MNRGVVIFSWLLISGLVHAGEATGGARLLDLDDCIAAAQSNSLRIRNARIDELVADERAISAGAMFDTRLSATANKGESALQDAQSFLPGDKDVDNAAVQLSKTLCTGTRLGMAANQSSTIISGSDSLLSSIIQPYSASVSVSLSQSLLKNAFGDMDRAALRVSALGRDAAAYLRAREEQLVILQVCEAYWNLYSARRSHATSLGSLKRGQDLLESNRKKFKDGLIEETDILATEAMIANRTVDVLVLSNAVMNATDAMRAVIQVPASDWQSVAFAMPSEVQSTPAAGGFPASDSLVASALSSRSDLAALRLLAEQAVADGRIKRSAARPDLQFVASAARGDNGTERSQAWSLEESAWSVGLLFTVPLARTLERSALHQSLLTAEKAGNNVAAMETAVALECRAAERGLASANERVGATARAAELQSRKFRLEKQKYDEGRSQTYIIVQYEDDASVAEMSYNVSVGEYHKALARLMTALGHNPSEGLK